MRPSDETGFPAPRTIEFLLENDPEHAPMKPTQSWMDRINTAQLEIGRDRWQAMGALAKFDTLGGLAALKCPVLMLYGENFIYGKHRALLHSKCPHAKLEIVPGGRFCMSWERADDIAAAARGSALDVVRAPAKDLIAVCHSMRSFASLRMTGESLTRANGGEDNLGGSVAFLFQSSLGAHFCSDPCLFRIRIEDGRSAWIIQVDFEELRHRGADLQRYLAALFVRHMVSHMIRDPLQRRAS